MELDEAILNRRSCRSYDQTKHVSKVMMREIVHCWDVGAIGDEQPALEVHGP